MTTEPRLLSIEDAAECMAVKEDTIRREIASGRLPKVQIGSRVLVPVAGIDWFIEQYAELGEEIWRDAIEKAVSAAVTRTERARATSAMTAAGYHKRLSIAGRGSRG